MIGIPIPNMNSLQLAQRDVPAGSAIYLPSHEKNDGTTGTSSTFKHIINHKATKCAVVVHQRSRHCFVCGAKVASASRLWPVH